MSTTGDTIAGLRGWVMDPIQPLRLNIPAEIRTERLLLRCPRVGEGAFIIDNVRTSLPELKTWMPWATDEYDLNGANDWCAGGSSVHHPRNSQLFHRRSQWIPAHGHHHNVCKKLECSQIEIGYWLVTTESVTAT